MILIRHKSSTIQVSSFQMSFDASNLPQLLMYNDFFFFLLNFQFWHEDDDYCLPRRHNKSREKQKRPIKSPIQPLQQLVLVREFQIKLLLFTELLLLSDGY